MGKHLVRAIADKQSCWVVTNGAPLASFRLSPDWVRVQAQMSPNSAANGLQRAGRGAVGVSLVLSLTRSGAWAASPARRGQVVDDGAQSLAASGSWPVGRVL